MSGRNFKIGRLILVLWVFVLMSCSEKPQTFSELLKDVQNKSVTQAEALLQDFCQRHNFPFTEDSTAYFLFEDTTKNPVYLAGDFTQWRPVSIALRRIGQTKFYFTGLVFPLKARLEYKFVVGKNWLLDPLNPFKEQGGLGDNSVLMMPEYAFPKEALLHIKYRISRLDTIEFKSNRLKNKRRVILYRHPKAGAAAPLLVFNDGSDYLRFARARVILDNLIGNKTIKPVNTLFVDPVHRNKEYWLNDGYLKMVFNELLPFVYKKFELHPNSLGFGGTSLGGEIALYALKNYGNQLNFVFSQSGALWIEGAKLFGVLQTIPKINAKVYLSYGKFEGMRKDYLKIRSILNKKDVHYQMQQFPEGHNWGNWRGHLKDALIFFKGHYNERDTIDRTP